jgi:hypothetical protein
LPLKDFRDVVNQHWPAIATRARCRTKASHGRLVNIASVAGLTGVFGYTRIALQARARVADRVATLRVTPMGITAHGLSRRIRFAVTANWTQAAHRIAPIRRRYQGLRGIHRRATRPASVPTGSSSSPEG